MLAGGLAWGAIGDGGVIQGCYDSGGNVKVVSALPCPKGYTPFRWNQEGPQGPPGPSGTLAWAYVASDGTVLDGSGNVTVAHVAPGSYCVGVTGGTVHAAMAILDAVRNVGGTIQAGVYWGSDCPEEANDIVVVTRPHGQDGGLPGADRFYYLTVS
jgi:hypothetical protein